MAPSESTSENRPEAEAIPIINPINPVVNPIPIPIPIPIPVPIPPVTSSTPLSPTSPTVTTTAPTSSVSVTVPNTSGTVTFSLVVTDNLGVQSAPAFATVTIQGAPVAVIAATPPTVADGRRDRTLRQRLHVLRQHCELHIHSGSTGGVSSELAG